MALKVSHIFIMKIGLLRSVLLLSAFLFFSAGLQAQDAVVRGTVKDKVTNSALEYSSVSVLNPADSSVVGGGLTKGTGNFEVKGLKAGKYLLKVQFIGYQTEIVPDITVADGEKLNVGTINLAPVQKLLEEIKVSGQRAAAYNKIDKQVYKADQFQSAKGGTAIDVLKNMPSISVNGQGEITMRGSNGFLVLINGKPVQTDAGVVLSQLSANSIENIELITAPSAKYDADGKAGIINITTKRGADDRFSITVNAQGGLPSVHDYGNKEKPKRFGGDATLNYKKNKWDITVGANYLRNDNAGYREGNVNTTINNIYTSFPSTGERSFKKKNYGVRASVAYTADKNNSFNVGFYNGYRFQARLADLLYNNSKTNKSTGQTIARTTYFNSNLQTKEGKFTLGNFDYTHTFANKSSLTASLLYEHANLYGNTKNRNLFYPNTKDTMQYTYNPFSNPLDGYRLKLDYAVKIDSGILEAGYQFRYDKQEGDFVYQTKILNTNQYYIDPAFTSNVKANNQIHALYTQYSGRKNKLDYVAGLRYEYSTRGLLFTGETKERELKLSNLFPSANILYRLGNRWQTKAGFSRRIQRTTNFELNPFPEREHSETLEQGDPNLLPEFVNLTELGLIKTFNSGSFFTTLYHQEIKNPIQRVNKVYADTVLNRVFTNAGKANLWGAELGTNLKPAKWWQFYLGANVYNYKIKGSIFNGTIPISNNGLVYSINTNSNFQLAKTLSVQFNLNYLSDRPTAQGEDSRFLIPNSSIKKTFFNGRMSAMFQWQNMDLGLLKTNEQRITTSGKDFYTTTNYIYEVDVLMLNISFNLNQLSKKSKLPTSEFGDKEF